MSVLTRRSLLTAGVGAGLGIVTGAILGGCSRGGEADASEGTQTLRAAWYGGDPVHDGLTAALDAYGADHPEVAIGTEYAPFADYWDRLATQTAGGDAPDVFRMSMTYFAEYADRGALLDLADLFGGGGIDAAGLDEDVRVSGDVAGGTFGVGQSSIVYAVFVDPDQLEAIGEQAPVNGWTWEEFEALATAFAEASDDGGYGCNDNGGVFQAFEVFARQRTGDLFTADGALGFEVDAVEEWFAYWDRLRRAGVVPPGDVTAETQGFENALLVHGRCPMQWGWVQQVTFYQPLTEASLQVVSVPATSGDDLSGLFIKALDFWCVSAQTASPDRAASVVDFLLNDSRAIEAIGLTLGVPPSQNARDVLAPERDSAEGRAIAYVEELTEKVGPPPPAWPTGYSAIGSAFARANEQVAFGELDAAAAAAAVVGEAAAALGT